MALFGRKKKDDVSSNDEVVVKSEKKASSGGKRKRNEMLSSVFSETVMDQALSEMRDNPAFDITLGGHLFHAIWLLKASDIGGLNKRMKRNEDHGAIIQCMSSGRIKYVLNSVMDDADYVGFIMDADTCEAMDEFSLLTEATYHAMYISDEKPAVDMLMDADVSLSFEDAQEILSGSVDCETKLESCGSTIFTMINGKKPPVVDAEEEGLFSVPQVYDVDEEDFDDFDNTTVTTSDDLSAIDAALGNQYAGGNDIAMSRQAGDGFDIARQNAQSVIERDVTEVNATTDNLSNVIGTGDTNVVNVEMPGVSDRYFTSDLQLAINADAFDSHFGEGIPISYFDEDRGEGLLNEYLSQMSVSANSELSQLHGQHMYALRERYMHLLTLFADTLTTSYDLSSSSNPYGEAYMKLLAKFAEDNTDDGIARLAEVRKKELRDEFESRVSAAGDAARANAENAYRERYTDEYRANLRNIEAEVRANLETTRVSDLNNLNDARRLAANKEFDLGRERILEKISELQLEYSEEEQNVFQQHLDAMNKWVDDNRKDDIAYAETLREQQRQLAEAERVRKEYESYIEAERSQYENAKSRMEEELESIKAHNVEVIDDLNNRHGLDVDAWSAKYDDLQARFDNLLAEYSAVEDKKEAEWAERVEFAQEAAEVERNRYDDLARQSKSVHIMCIALAIVIAVAAFFVGMIFGLQRNIDYSSAKAVEETAGAMAPIVFGFLS